MTSCEARSPADAVRRSTFPLDTCIPGREAMQVPLLLIWRYGSVPSQLLHRDSDRPRSFPSLSASLLLDYLGLCLVLPLALPRPQLLPSAKHVWRLLAVKIAPQRFIAHAVACLHARARARMHPSIELHAFSCRCGWATPLPSCCVKHMDVVLSVQRCLRAAQMALVAQKQWLCGNHIASHCSYAVAVLGGFSPSLIFGTMPPLTSTLTVALIVLHVGGRRPKDCSFFCFAGFCQPRIGERRTRERRVEGPTLQGRAPGCRRRVRPLHRRRLGALGLRLAGRRAIRGPSVRLAGSTNNVVGARRRSRFGKLAK